LLAWRGPGNSVVTPAKDGKGVVTMLDQNDIAARRLYQLFVPGLSELTEIHRAISVDNVYHFNPNSSRLGFLYL